MSKNDPKISRSHRFSKEDLEALEELASRTSWSRTQIITWLIHHNWQDVLEAAAKERERDESIVAQIASFKVKK